MAIMDFFDPKRKEKVVETDNDLPGFTVDVNGFIMFNDLDLGGCGIFEVEPAVMGGGMTHHDDYSTTVSSDEKYYEPLDGWIFGDRRKDVVPQWVRFLNGLFPKDPSDTQTQIQIIMKKTRPAEGQWRTRANYALCENDAAIGAFYQRAGYDVANDGKSVLMQARANDYLAMLKRMSDESNIPSYTLDMGKLPSYAVKMYIVVSHTPSSEGWWIDGRDGDYYLKDDTLDGDSMFGSSPFVNQIASFLTRKMVRKMYEDGNNTANDLFPFKSDITAQVIETRMRRIEQTLSEIFADTPEDDRMFRIRRLSPREAAALVHFYPDILTRYWDKAIENLKENINDIYYGFDTKNALMTGDDKYLGNVANDIIYGNVDLGLDSSVESKWLDKYRGMTADDVAGTIDEVYQDYQNKPILDEDEVKHVLGEDVDEEDPIEDMWQELGGFTIHTTDEQDDESRRRDYLKRYSKRSLTVGHERENRQIRERLAEKKDELAASRGIDHAAIGIDNSHSDGVMRVRDDDTPRGLQQRERKRQKGFDRLSGTDTRKSS